jgi:N6-L-threonylcarbamoyladenine synthase
MIAGVAYQFLNRGETSPWTTTATARVTEFKRGIKAKS